MSFFGVGEKWRERAPAGSIALCTVAAVAAGSFYYFYVTTRTRSREERATTLKTIYLIRHGQSTFNAEYSKTEKDPMIFDAPLSKLGGSQVEDLNAKCLSGELEPSPEVVLCSPLTRALQTALGGFKGTEVPIEVEPLLREHLTDSCDIGRIPAQLKAEFAGQPVSFHKLERIWWFTDPDADEPQVSPEACRRHFSQYGYMEPPGVLEARVEQMVELLRTHPATCIALVGHADYMNLLADCITGQDEDLWLDNCEVRKFELAEEVTV